MAYNPAQWDSLPINDDNLYALLQRATGPPTLTLDPTRFPAPAVDNPTPPASEESSPSPPSIKEREQFNAYRATRRAAFGNEDDHTKRKQDDISDSDDSSYEQPSKHQHRSSDKDGGSNGPRRSSGGNKKKSGNPDENRALKRKEQNRAAQRAFRERKERHVKELEDQVAALEAKSANQDRENENLRDLLGRLQNENLLLKQSAFTFSFPPGGNNATPSADATQSSSNSSFRRPVSPKLSSPSSSSSASTPEKTTGEIPESTLFARPSSARPSINGSSSTSASSGSSPRSEATTSRFQSSPGAFGLGTHLPEYNGSSSGLDFFGSGQDLNLLNTGSKTNTVNGVTTIAANPMYMSFGDPVLDPMAWASFGPTDYATGASTSPPGIGGNQSDMDIFSLASFGNNSAVNVPPHSNGVGNTVNGTGATGYSSIEDFFGASSTGSGVTPSFLDFGGAGSMTGGHSTASSSTGGATFSSGSPSAAGSLSDVHSGDDGSSDTCPKTIEEVQRLQQGASPSTFGPPIALPKSNTTSPGPPGSSPSSSNDRSASPQTNSEACAHARMAALCADLPHTSKKPNQIEIGRAWEKIRQHQGFEDCDIDQLCNELSSKARCDGSRPVLEEASFNNIVQSLGAMHKKRSNPGPVGPGAMPASAMALS